MTRRVELESSYSVRIQTALNSGTGTVFNISRGGMYVLTSMRILPQAQVVLYLPVPKSRKILRIEAVTSWEDREHEKLDGRPTGYGFRFINVADETRSELQELMDSESLSKQRMHTAIGKLNLAEEAGRLLANMLPSYGWIKK